MARYLYAWEIGRGTGGLAAFLPVARRLTELGHEVSFALADLTEVEGALGRRGFSLYQAPLPKGDPSAPAEPRSTAELLLHLGYAKTDATVGLLRAWLELFRLSQPTWLIAQQAPTAILAARLAQLPVANFGDGFTLPPAHHFSADFWPWAPAEEDRLDRAMERALDAINLLFGRFGRPSGASLPELFAGEARLLVSIPELDPFAELRGSEPHLGVLDPGVAGQEVSWPNGDGPRILFHFPSRLTDVLGLIASLDRLRAQCLLYCPWIAPATASQLSTASLRVHTKPIQFASLLPGAHAFVGPARTGVVYDALRAGSRLAVLPLRSRERLLAHRLSTQALARLVSPETLSTELEQLLTEPRPSPLAGEARQTVCERVVDEVIRLVS